MDTSASARSAGPQSCDLTLTFSSPPHPDHPFLSAQVDWELLIASASTSATSSTPSPSSFWLSSTDSSHETVEGQCQVVPSPTAPLPTLTQSPPFTARLVSPLLLSLSCSATRASYTLQAPSFTLPPHRLGHVAKQPITSVGFSPTNPDHLLTGSTEGSLTLSSLTSTSPSTPTPFVGHAGDVDVALFFPSGQVVLTSALDRSFRIWTLAGHCAATPTGHQQRVTAVALIDRGRHFVSSALDGSVKLWDCGQGKAIADYGVTTATSRTTSAAVNTCALLRPGAHPLPLSSGGGDAGQYEGWVVAAGCEDGHVRGYDMRVPSSSSPVLDVITGAAVTALTQPAPHTLAVALTTGTMGLVDLRRMEARAVWRRERDVAVVRMEAEDERWLWSADELGVVTRWDTAAQQPTVDRELTGIDMEPVRGWALQRGATGRVERIATAADAVRIYVI